MSTKADLNIAEIPYETGELQFRYARYLADDGTRWIRHGLYRRYHRNGNVASEGLYEHGVEQGIWKDYHQNGQLAAEGEYRDGKQVGQWSYWNDTGEPETDGSSSLQ